jgi:hypothetical protein
VVEVMTGSAWGFMVDGEWTMGVTLRLPAGPEQLWSPIITCGSPLLGRAGASLTWVGSDSDERPTADPGWPPPVRTPGAGLLMVGIVEPRPHAITSARQASLVVTMEPAAQPDSWTSLVVTRRCDGPTSELTVHLDDRTATARSAGAGRPATAPEPLPSGPTWHPDDDRLLIGGHPAGPTTPFLGVVREVVVVDRALDDAAVAGLAAHLRSTRDR